MTEFLLAAVNESAALKDIQNLSFYIMLACLIVVLIAVVYKLKFSKKDVPAKHVEEIPKSSFEVVIIKDKDFNAAEGKETKRE